MVIRLEGQLRRYKHCTGTTAVCKTVCYVVLFLYHILNLYLTLLSTVYLNFTVHMFDISSICMCLAVVYIIVFNNFDVELSGNSLHNKLHLIMYNIQYRIIVYS